MKHDKTEEVSFVRSLITDIAIAAVLAGAVLFFIRPTIVKQTSMLNTLQPNDYLIMYKRAYSGDKTPERGDIVIFESNLINEETGKDKWLIKRVIGLPGDTIEIIDDQLYLNGEKYEEDYLADGITTVGDAVGEGETFTVPADQYFCMGDNRVVSIDSRYEEVGCITKDKIMGKAVLRLFPFNKITTL